MPLASGAPPRLSAGPNDRPKDGLLTWNKPVQRPPGCPVEEFAALPAALAVRLLEIQVAVPGFRTPPRRAGDDPARRPHSTPPPSWASCTCGAGPWNCISVRSNPASAWTCCAARTPAMIHKELQMHLIAYHLVRVIMQQTAVTQPCAADAPQLQRLPRHHVQWPPRCTPHGAVRANKPRLYRAILEISRGINCRSVPAAVNREPKKKGDRKTITFLTKPPPNQMRVPATATVLGTIA